MDYRLLTEQGHQSLVLYDKSTPLVKEILYIPPISFLSIFILFQKYGRINYCNRKGFTMKKETKGLFIVMLCAFLWAFNGNIGGWLFKTKNFTPEDLVVVRLLGAGFSILLYNSWKKGSAALSILKVKANYLPLAFYAIGGILLMQFGYFVAILYSNAPTSTLLEYLGTFLLLFFLSIQYKKWPERKVFLALIVSIFGVVLLVTHGNFSVLSINEKALFWGLLSALGYATFNVAPLKLQARYTSMDIVGPAMILGGVTLFLLVRPHTISTVTWDFYSILALLYCIFGGTFFPFVLFMEGQRLAGPSLSGIFSLSEPVFSTLIAVLLYGTIFSPIDLLGMVFILGSILLLTIQGTKKEKG